MSTRRHLGDRVWVLPDPWSGQVGEWATIMTGGTQVKGAYMAWNLVDDNGHSPDRCSLECGDPDCREWPNLATDTGTFFYHLSECRMADGPE